MCIKKWRCLKVDIEDFVTAREAGLMLNINRARVGVLCREGRFNGAKKIGLGWMIPREAVQNFKRLPPGLKPQNPKREEIKTIISEALEQAKEGDTNDKQ